MFEGAKAFWEADAYHRAREGRFALDDAHQRIRELEAALEKAKTELDVSRASTAGLIAKFSLVQRLHPDSYIFEITHKKFPDGKLKNKARLVWEEVFDSEMKKRGYRNPSAYRD